MKPWNNQLELDVDSLIRYIMEVTGIELEIVDKVLEAELDYLVSVGIAERKVF